MGVFNTRRKAQYTMKVQFILAACLVAAAFAAPIDNFVDPDCIEEDLVVEEPSQEIEADFALGLPDLRMDFGAPQGDEECEDEAVTEPVAAQKPPKSAKSQSPPKNQQPPQLKPSALTSQSKPPKPPQNQPPLVSAKKKLKPPPPQKLTNALKRVTKSPQNSR